MDTAQHLTHVLRRELRYPRILAVPDPGPDRWCVYELRRRMSGGWGVPYSLSDAGEVRPGTSTVRLVADFADLIYVHEIDGKYAEANPHLILAALRQQDRWRGARLGDLERSFLARVHANREKRRADSSEAFADLAQEHRRAFVQAADEMGL